MIRIAIACTLSTVTIWAWATADGPRVTPAENGRAISVPENREIQFGGFLALGEELKELRASRRVPVSTFVKMAKEPGTIILDTRSRSAYEDVHIANAIHLNFSDFTDEKLKKTIASKKTRVLIYCNNNFIDDSDLPNEGAENVERRNGKGEPGVVQGFTNKLPTLALNIPTFINLHGYGYQNVYELADRLHVDDKRINLVGKAVRDSDQ